MHARHTTYLIPIAIYQPSWTKEQVMLYMLVEASDNPAVAVGGELFQISASEWSVYEGKIKPALNLISYKVLL